FKAVIPVAQVEDVTLCLIQFEIACADDPRCRSADAQGIEGVVDDVQVEIAVPVEIAPCQARAPVLAADSTGESDIAECSVAIVAVQNIRTEVGDRQVGETVIIVIAGGTPLAVLIISQATAGRDLGTPPVSQVAIQPIKERRIPGIEGDPAA